MPVVCPAVGGYRGYKLIGTLDFIANSRYNVPRLPSRVWLVWLVSILMQIISPVLLWLLLSTCKCKSCSKDTQPDVRAATFTSDTRTRYTTLVSLSAVTAWVLEMYPLCCQNWRRRRCCALCLLIYTGILNYKMSASLDSKCEKHVEIACDNTYGVMITKTLTVRLSIFFPSRTRNFFWLCCYGA